MVRWMLKDALKDANLSELLETDNATSALQTLREAAKTAKPFDYILCDWHMPDVSGLELLKLCRDDKNLNGLKFILVSADSDGAAIETARQAGAFDYLLKPWTKASLGTILNHMREHYKVVA